MSQPSGVSAADAAALRAVSLGYAAATDGLDGPGFADLFTPDGELWVPDPRMGGEPTTCRTGREQLAAIPSHLARYHATHHGLGATTFRVDGGTATGEVGCVAHHLTADHAPSPDGRGGLDEVWYLRYVDDYRRTGGVWLLARRALHLRRVEHRRVAHVGPGRA